MSVRRFPLSFLPVSRRQWLAVAIISLVVIMHLVLVDWAKDSLALIHALDEEDETVIVEFRSSGDASPAAPARPERPPKPPVERVAPMVPALPAVPDPPTAPPPAPPTAAAEPTAPVEPSAPVPEVAASANGTAAAMPEPALPASAATPEPRSDADAATPLFTQVSFPPSVELTYDALATQGSRRLSGSGSVSWQNLGQSYQIRGEASALLLNLLSYQSSGQIGSAGMLPELYEEKRIGKSATRTHFVRERKTISFSASTRTVEIRGGEQDRGSVIWQLAGLARGDPDKLAPGLGFEAIVAGSKSADRWQVVVIGKESVSTTEGTVSGWHLSLAPVENQFDYQIDLWLSPDRDWYPVKISYSNRSGASLTLSLSRLHRP